MQSYSIRLDPTRHASIFDPTRPYSTILDMTPHDSRLDETRPYSTLDHHSQYLILEFRADWMVFNTGYHSMLNMWQYSLLGQSGWHLVMGIWSDWIMFILDTRYSIILDKSPHDSIWLHTWPGSTLDQAQHLTILDRTPESIIFNIGYMLLIMGHGAHCSMILDQAGQYSILDTWIPGTRNTWQ